MAWMLVTLTVAGYALGLAWFLRRCPDLAPADPAPGDAGTVTVLIPARDEAGVIDATLDGVRAQGPALAEVRVVDDASADDTAARVRRHTHADARVGVHPAPPVPPGWFGKTHALQAAARQASGRWLLFLDADTALAPGAIDAALAAARREGASFLSVWPRQETGGFWERRVQPLSIGLAAAGNALQRLAGPPFPAALSAWGAFVLVRADAYQRVGGHGAVRDRILDDTELCRAFRRAGEHTVAFRAPALVRVRMYHGLADLWQGWRKNLFDSLGRSLPATLASAAVVLLVTWGPGVGLFAAAVAGGAWTAWAVPLALQLVVLSPLASRVVATPPYLGASPLGGAVFAALLAASAWAALAGDGVRWKGRRYVSDEEA